MNAASLRYRQLAHVLPGSSPGPSIAAPPIEDLEALLQMAMDQKVLPALGDPYAIHALSLPEELAQSLAGILELNTLRNEALKGQAMEAIQALNREGIAPLLVKGGAAMVEGLYKVPGALITADIDLAVREQDVLGSVQILLRAGFEETAPITWNGHHIPPLLHKATQTCLELHRWICKPGTQNLLPESEYWSRTQLKNDPAVGVYHLLDPTDALVHSIIHAQLHHAAYLCRSIRLRNLYDFALLSDKHRADIDWERVLHTGRSFLYSRAAHWTLSLVGELFPWCGSPKTLDSAPFARLKLSMTGKERAAYRRQMTFCNTLLLNPGFACSHYARRLASLAGLRKAAQDISVLFRHASLPATNRH